MRNELQGRLIRSLIAKSDTRWRSLVPEEVANYIESIGGVERVKRILESERVVIPKF